MPFDINLRTESVDVESSFSVGEEVWVKPSPPSGTKQWMPGKVTRIVFKHTVCVEGMHETCEGHQKTVFWFQ